MEKRVEFYGGSLGAWIPMIVFIIGMVISTMIGGGGVARLSLVAFIALVIGFFLVKDKKSFGNLSLKGLQNPMLGTIIMAFLMAGILSQLLRQSGLINALIWVVSTMGLNVGLIPLIAFITCMLISTSCGTSSGSVAAVAPVLVPLAASLNIDVGFMCGAIISGAIFGDNLAPISDTTIGSALTQEAEVSDVVRTRLPYAMISAGVSGVLFAIFGLNMSTGAVAEIVIDGSSARALALLVLPIIMVIMMRKQWDLVSTLIICNVMGVVLNLVLGTIAPSVMFSNAGPVVAGMSGMMVLILYVMLLFQVLEMLISSGAFDQIGTQLARVCKTPRSAELVCYGIASIGSAASGGSGIAIMFFGPLVRKILKSFQIDRCRGANILDGVACGTTGLLPYGNPVIISIGVALTVENIDPSFSFLNIIPYTFHCWGLLLIFLILILTGIGRKYEETDESTIIKDVPSI